MRRFRIIGVALVLACCAALADDEPISPLAPLDFLLGTWEATSEGSPASLLGTTTFERQLANKVVVRTCHATVPAAKVKGKGAATHDDLMVIYADSDQKLHADSYDSDGRVIRYTIETTDDSAVFTSDPSPGMGRSRITYRLAYAGIVSGEYETSTVGEPEAFGTPLTWTMKHPAAKSR